MKAEQDWPLVLGALATVLMLVDGFAYLWSTAWRFGDEQLTRPSH